MGGSVTSARKDSGETPEKNAFLAIVILWESTLSTSSVIMKLGNAFALRVRGKANMHIIYQNLIMIFEFQVKIMFICTNSIS